MIRIEAVFLTTVCLEPRLLILRRLVSGEDIAFIHRLAYNTGLFLLIDIDYGKKRRNY